MPCLNISDRLKRHAESLSHPKLCDLSFQFSNTFFLFLSQDGLVNIRRRLVGHLAHLIDGLCSTIRLSRILMLPAASGQTRLDGAGFLFLGGFEPSRKRINLSD